ncbi:M13 family metallopeptidase [Demequina subtropica]|uniref:M13 family metallopeptidase n=1 Tax=Demequina subtropica TaxID=1638989 RepID=UPI0007848C02|nr:M13-type metalloendopeptidase [Demequina subtropica]
MTLRTGIDRSEFSSTVRAQDDFFRYISGPWEETHEIPGDRAADGSFYTLRDEAEKQVRVIIEEAERTSQIGALYASFMDVDRVNALGVGPLAADLERVEAATSHEELARVMGELQRDGVSGAAGYYVFADRLDPDRNVVYLGQSGIGLPDEAYYRGEAHAETREKYVAHVDRMAGLTGLAFDSSTVVGLETAIAREHWDVVKTREAELTHNPTTLAGLAEDAPGFPWAAWAEAIRMPEAAHGLLVVGEPSYFTAFAKIWAETELDTWKAYLRWRIVNSRAAYLTEELSKANFDFYGTVLSGATEQRERWKRAVGLVEGVVGELVGQEYVARHFPPEYKAQMDALVENLIEAYRVSIESLDWMTPGTQEKALEKLRQFTPKIGYPDTWRDYTGLEVSPEDLVGNVRAASAFEEDWEWGKIGKPVDRSEWLMTPQTVNAYYLPVANEIVFPAAILQPPFFHPEADAAVNYGGIGSVIGHEIGHGFDDQGSKYSGTGALEDWWTEADREAFMERAKRLIAQYDGYSPKQLDGSHHVNGALTVGENIGDLAGVEISLKAYEIALGHPIDEAPELDGLTAVQRFFIGYALTERMKVRSEALVTRLATDPHSPSEFRVNGIVRNMDAWYEAFEVSPEDALWLDPEERVSIW